MTTKNKCPFCNGKLMRAMNDKKRQQKWFCLKCGRESYSLHENNGYLRQSKLK